MSSTATATATAPSVDLAEVARRRTFAIISHPDAGKTTLTEKLLLHAGAVQEAGAVKSRKTSRAARSDWMALEQERGISVTSAVMHFPYEGWRLNLLDTPGHADFSEDTYRTLWAADAAVMVLDGARGLEPQTLKLFRVCRERGVPIVTFVNKCDRPMIPPLQLLDEIAGEIGVRPVPQTWPVGDGPEFAGVIDRHSAELLRFDREADASRLGTERREPIADVDQATVSPGRWETALEESDLLDLAVEPLDREAVLAGTETPLFFGSALTSFGVKALLDGFVATAPPPGDQPTADGDSRAVASPFSAQVFKVQANMDPRHRDRVAFMRVNSGPFTRGMTATVERTGRPFQLKYAHQLFADQRDTVDAAVAGDIVGVVNATDIQVGDTLFDPDGPPVRFPRIPTFAPERFVRIRNGSTGKAKQFRKGIHQLDEEGVVLVLRDADLGDQEPILAGVGQLQFDVAAWRMVNEFGAEVRVEPGPWEQARLARAEDVEALRALPRVTMVFDRFDRPVALFPNAYALQGVRERHPDLTLEPLGLSPQHMAS